MTDELQGHGPQPIEYDWDEAKNERNLTERELSYDLAILMFELPVVQFLDDRRDYGELRMRAIGLVGNLFLHCVYTDRADVRRIISLRRANRKERDVYRSKVGG